MKILFLQLKCKFPVSGGVLHPGGFSIGGVLHPGGFSIQGGLLHPSCVRGVLHPGGFSIQGGSLSGGVLHPEGGSPSGGFSIWGVLHLGGFSIWGVSIWGEFSIWGVLHLGGLHLGGIPCDLSHHAFDVTCMLSPHQLRPTNSAAAYIVVVQGMMGYPPPPVNRITDTCQNITFPQLRLRAVINLIYVKTCSIRCFSSHCSLQTTVETATTPLVMFSVLYPTDTRRDHECPIGDVFSTVSHRHP